MLNEKAFTCEQLIQMSETNRLRMAEFAVVVTNHRGCTTPAEEMILDLVRGQALGGWAAITPDDIEKYLKSFREEFDYAIEAAKSTVANYPGDVLGGPDCPRAYRDQHKRMWEIARENGLGDPQGQVLSYLEIARLCIREFPALVLSAESIEEVAKPLPKDY
ncbi:MAG: hypothetical protein JWN34_2859 [Bryobacterales bacterium]|nr:hypothetical protein [Bryobacterales bacterium]